MTSKISSEMSVVRTKISCNWSSLPLDLLNSIGNKLGSDNRADLLNFRGVCRSWRSSTSLPENTSHLPMEVTFLIKDFSFYDVDAFIVCKTTVYVLKPAVPRSHPAHNRSWLLKVRENLHGKMQVFNPFSKMKIFNLPESFPKTRTTLDFRFKEVANFVTLQREGFIDDPVDEETRIHKVVISSTPCFDNEYLLLGIKGSNLCFMKVSDSEWVSLDDEVAYRDIVNFKGVFFGVDMFGGVVIVHKQDENMVKTPLTRPPPGIARGEMYFVESKGDLYIVTRDLDDYEHVVYYDEDIDGYIYDVGEDDEIPVKFIVFKLIIDEEIEGIDKYSWEILNDLGDQAFCVNKDCSFSVDANDFRGFRGNCIYFVPDIQSPVEDGFIGFDYIDVGNDDTEDDEGSAHGNCRDGDDLEDEDDDKLGRKDILVYHLEDGDYGPIACYPQYRNIFWPPPKWFLRSN